MRSTATAAATMSAERSSSTPTGREASPPRASTAEASTLTRSFSCRYVSDRPPHRTASRSGKAVTVSAKASTRLFAPARERAGDRVHPTGAAAESHSAAEKVCTI